MQGNVADTMLNILAERGIGSIYGVSGDAVFPFLDALSRQDRIKYYAAATETGAAFMASAAGKLTGRPGVCLATSGPGCANLVNGLADAYFDRAPVLAITGQVATKKLGTNAKQYFNQQQLVGTFAGMSEPVVHPEAAGPLLALALEKAGNEKTVVHLSIPEDVFLMPVPETGARPNPERPRINGCGQVLGSGFAAGLEQAAASLNNSQRPILVIGQRGPEVGELCLSLAEQLGAGIVLAQQAKGTVPDGCPLVLGGIGEGYLPPVLKKTDILLLVGPADFELKFLPASAPLIQIAEQTDSLHFERLGNGLVGPPGRLLKLLLERTSPRRTGQTAAWTGEIAGGKKNFLQLLALDARNNQVPVHPARLIAALNQTAAEDAVIACDIGSFIHWFDRGFQARSQTVLVSNRWRSMGTGIPAAISAKICHPGKQVLALVGDGGFLMSMAEILTAVKYRLPVTVIVANNHQYSLETQRMQAQGMTPLGNDILTPDFAVFAGSCGAQGFRLTDPARLEATLGEAFNCGQPAVVDVQVADIPLPNLT